MGWPYWHGLLGCLSRLRWAPEAVDSQPVMPFASGGGSGRWPLVHHPDTPGGQSAGSAVPEPVV